VYKKVKLDNGLRIITHSMPKRHSVAVGIWIKVGGRYESEEHKGIAHFLEHLVFKGSKKYSCRKLKESIEGVGGSLNGFTSEEMTCYLAKLPERHLNLGLEILSDMAMNPKLMQEEIDKERTVILEEIKMYKDLPQSYVHELLDELLWPKHALGMPIAGTAESVSRINRENMSSFQKKHYTSSNMVVSVAGNLEHDKLTKKVRTIFSGVKTKHIDEFSAVKEEQKLPQFKLLAKETEQTHLSLGFHAFKREHPLRHALGLLHVILGANMSSRLFNELREKRGLAYEIGTNIRRFQDTGAFIVHAGIDNHKVEEAIMLILKELEKIKYKLVSTDEFRRAKDFYLGQLTLALEDALDHMLWIGEYTTALDKTYTLEQVIKEVNRVKCQDIQEAAKNIFQESHLNLALIGPLKDSEQNITNQLHIG
jgi:predicted Zn-dependent peptidase